MVPCAVSWCVALTEKTFCPIHEENQHLHPSEIEDDDLDDDVLLEDDDNDTDDENEEEGEDDD